MHIIHLLMPLALLLQDAAQQTASADSSWLPNIGGSAVGGGVVGAVLYFIVKPLIDTLRDAIKGCRDDNKDLGGKVDKLGEKQDDTHNDVREVKTLITTGQGCRINNQQKAGV